MISNLINFGFLSDPGLLGVREEDLQHAAKPSAKDLRASRSAQGEGHVGDQR